MISGAFTICSMRVVGGLGTEVPQWGQGTKPGGGGLKPFCKLIRKFNLNSDVRESEHTHDEHFNHVHIALEQATKLVSTLRGP